ncbi:hypothetical protein RHGRI_018408 [Rhododendron griersonianum]|uniref:VQ domain-containing protein n=1 Tax=Rhododendron griersonianum TaxID=479676 RepID=A0AAV6K1F2_9ERIC|nr:hypothetical protein RHGRI_018408 [Rhododendron griersonianum]
MEITSRAQERQNPSPTTSPNSNTNGVIQIQTRPLAPKPISRPETISYPTTFIQADTTTFKQLVQTLTGTPRTGKQASSKHSSSIPPVKTGQKKQGSSKLYERRSNLKNGLMISPMGQDSGALSGKDKTLSPCVLDFPLLALSPVTPLVEYPFGKSSSSFEGNSSSVEEEKAIAEKGFYLHPSPRTSTLKGSGPLLLPLFPVTSPRVFSDSSY